ATRCARSEGERTSRWTSRVPADCGFARRTGDQHAQRHLSGVGPRPARTQKRPAEPGDPQECCLPGPLATTVQLLWRRPIDSAALRGTSLKEVQDRPANPTQENL